MTERRRRVAVAIIEKEGRVLIAQRNAGGSFPLFWELPGGGCFKGEDPATCVAREVKEETGLTVRPEACAGVFEHSYPELTVEIHVFFCSILAGEARPLESRAVAWIDWNEIGSHRFPPANEQIFSQARRLKECRMTNDD